MCFNPPTDARTHPPHNPTPSASPARARRVGLWRGSALAPLYHPSGREEADPEVFRGRTGRADGGVGCGGDGDWGVGWVGIVDG